jgi:hypothetical protein
MSSNNLPDTGGADNLNGLCRKHKISRTKYYDLDQKGLGPRYFLVGNQRRFSHEAQAEWRRKMEAMAAAAEGGQIAEG